MDLLSSVGREFGQFSVAELAGLFAAALLVLAVGRWLFRTPNSNKPTHKDKPAEVDKKPTPPAPKETVVKVNVDPTPTNSQPQDTNLKPSIKIFYASQTGTAEMLATKLAEAAAKDPTLLAAGITVEPTNLADFNVEDLKWERAAVFIVSTYEGGKFPAKAKQFGEGLEDMAFDFRVSKNHFKDLGYAIFGLGHKDYRVQFNKASKNVHRHLRSLSARTLFPMCLADVSSNIDIVAQLEAWTRGSELWKGFIEQLSFKQNNSASKPAAELVESESDDELERGGGAGEEDGGMIDVEDLGASASTDKGKRTAAKGKAKRKVASEAAEEEEQESEEKYTGPDSADSKYIDVVTDREMLTPTLRKALSKQGYRYAVFLMTAQYEAYEWKRLLGSHSGVKLCRWTKSMLRGRGGCYKHTFYGISSFQCMEMTPSLACANKCVFCWRHHSNPVGTHWKWKVDDPAFLVEQAISNHRQMVRQFRGVPGVEASRFLEANTIKHCALSLVGEPIIYPYINDFIELLHQHHISSFLVTNAQFPEKMDKLKPVTQMYISVDAATKDSLKAVDRPLFADFWERFLASIDSLRKRGQRTVFRLTLIKEWNMTEIANYAQLIFRGLPELIEIKGVTYCGYSEASSLTMANVPFHQEVIKFAQIVIEEANKLIGREKYKLACEHEHSCCLLIADVDKFLVNNEWYTWIDYEKFHKLAMSGRTDFTSMDYMAKTPEWALFGNEHHGFDPEELRFHRKKTKTLTGGC